MEKPQRMSDDHSKLEETEASMGTPMDQETGRNSINTTSNNFCSHQRIIDEVRTRSGKVRCLECGATFDDPYQGLR